MVSHFRHKAFFWSRPTSCKVASKEEKLRAQDTGILVEDVGKGRVDLAQWGCDAR